MSYTIQDVYNDLESVLHGTTINQITNVDGLIQKAARKLLSDVDPNETTVILPLTSPVFYDVWNYPLPVDLKGTKIIDIFPQVNRSASDSLSHTYNQQFDTTKQSATNGDFTVVFNNGLKFIRINDPMLTTPVVLSTMSDTTGVVLTGTASNLKINNVNFFSSGASLQTDIGVGTGGIAITLPDSQDLSNQYEQASIFTYVYIPVAANCTSVTVKWGTDNANYWSRTLTLTQDNTSFVNGWNLLRADWVGATVTGVPDKTDVKWVAVDSLMTANQVGVLFDNFSVNMGTIMNIEYYSKYLFRDANSGVFQEGITDPTNVVNLDTDAFNLLLDLTSHYAAQQQQGQDALQFDATFWWDKYLEDKLRYTSLYKSQIIKPKLQYYSPRRGGYTGYIGRKLY